MQCSFVPLIYKNMYSQQNNYTSLLNKKEESEFSVVFIEHW